MQERVEATCHREQDAAGGTKELKERGRARGEKRVKRRRRRSTPAPND